MPADQTAEPLAYTSYGSPTADRAVIMLHGLYGSGGNWRSYGKRLGADYFVVVPDLRNHGHSPHNGDMSYQAQVSDLRRLLQEVVYANKAHTTSLAPIIIGHSMGGKVAMLYALTYADMPQIPVILDIAPLDYGAEHTASHHKILKAVLSTPAEANREAALAHLEQYGLEQRVCNFLLLSRYSRKNASDRVGSSSSGGAAGYAWRFNAPVLAERMADIVDFPQITSRAYKHKVYCIGGANSSYLVPQKCTSAMQTLFPEASFSFVPNSGHWLHAENPSGFWDALSTALADIEAQI